LTGAGRAARLATARRLRLALEDLGPTFVKFGQALSTRADLLPPDFLAEFSKLQDDVPALPAGVAEATIAAELGQPVGELFAGFDPVPIAAASIAQVHQATLASGERVAVKVRRPGIGPTIEGDLAILGQLAPPAERAPRRRRSVAADEAGARVRARFGANKTWHARAGPSIGSARTSLATKPYSCRVSTGIARPLPS
jgi:ubiquinone biosynthesis protein